MRALDHSRPGVEPAGRLYQDHRGIGPQMRQQQPQVSGACAELHGLDEIPVSKRMLRFGQRSSTIR